MTVDSGGDAVDVQELARQMLENQTGNEKDTESTEDDTTGGDNTQVDDTSTDDGEPNTDSNQLMVGGHPAWQEILSVVPEELQADLIPKLKEWDAGVTQRFQEIHSQYGPLKEFQALVDQGVDVDTLSQAVGLFNAVNQNPEEVYKTIGEAYGFSSEQESTDDEDEEYQLPRAVQEQLARQERAIESMAEALQGRTAQEQQDAQQAELERYLEGLTEEYGEFDEDYVLTKMASGVDGEVAVRLYQSKFEPAKPTAKKTAPKVLGTSGTGRGGVPVNKPEIGKLSNQDVRTLVADALKLSADQQT